VLPSAIDKGEKNNDRIPESNCKYSEGDLGKKKRERRLKDSNYSESTVSSSRISTGGRAEFAGAHVLISKRFGKSWSPKGSFPNGPGPRGLREHQVEKSLSSVNGKTQSREASKKKNPFWNGFWGVHPPPKQVKAGKTRSGRRFWGRKSEEAPSDARREAKGLLELQNQHLLSGGYSGDREKRKGAARFSIAHSPGEVP